MRTFTYRWFEKSKEGCITICEEGNKSDDRLYIPLFSMGEALELKRLSHIAAADFDRVKRYKVEGEVQSK